MESSSVSPEHDESTPGHGQIPPEHENKSSDPPGLAPTAKTSRYPKNAYSRHPLGLPRHGKSIPKHENLVPRPAWTLPDPEKLGKRAISSVTELIWP